MSSKSKKPQPSAGAEPSSGSDRRGTAKKKKYRGKKKAKDHSAKLPASSQDFSSNWRQIMNEISQPSKKRPSHKNINRSRTTIESAKPAVNSDASSAPSPPELWFDDVDEMLLHPEDQEALRLARKKPHANEGKEDENGLVKERGFKGLTRVVGMDCEMVGVGHGGSDSILARASLVNHFGHCIYDKYAKPTEKVTDYRTKVSGIRPKDLENGVDFKTIQSEVAEILKGRVLVGHALKHDLKVLFLDHPRRDIRDTATYKPFRAAFGGRTPSLKALTARMLGVQVQEGEHSSVQDAQAAVRLYTMFRRQWEGERQAKKKVKPTVADKPSESKQKVLSMSKAASQSGGQSKKTSRKLYQDSDDDSN